MTKMSLKVSLPSIILLPCLVLLSCKSTSSILVHPDAAELNCRAPDVFDVRLETSKGGNLPENFPLLDCIVRAAVADHPRREDLSNADSRIQFGGAPVELTISEVSERSLRIQLSALDETAHSRKALPSDALVPLPATEKLRVRELSREQRLRVGQLRVTIKPRPLTINVRRANGKLVQELVFDGGGRTNSISLRTNPEPSGSSPGSIDHCLFKSSKVRG